MGRANQEARSRQRFGRRSRRQAGSAGSRTPMLFGRLLSFASLSASYTSGTVAAEE
jgi:hypothetical protein